VYALTLPDEFPQGDELRADVTVTGLYFKNWSYSYDDGLPLTLQGVIWVATGTALFALVTVWSAVRKSVRRPRRDARLPDALLPPVDWAVKTRNGDQA
jgi:hypothetical protein